ncbi:MAG: GmrSD restriction endonuclease domain-containing protein [Bacteroidota bacterium]
MSPENVPEEQLIENIEDEQDDFYSDDDLYNISSWGADLSFRELVQRYKDGDLLKPEMQRNYVWDKAEASRFIDSILLGLPVPSIFLAKKSDEKMLIVDGYQRIMTVYDFIETKIFRKDSKVFKLTNSKKINARWRGKAFDELTELEQRKVRNTTIHSIIFVQLKPKENDTSMYQVFERINTSGRTLLPQEIRNCVYQGKFNELLIDLNKDSKWRKLFGLKEPDSRMRDIEFILRFFAIGNKKWKGEQANQISLKKFLNDCMGNEDYGKQDKIEANKKLFLQIIHFIHDNFGETAFQNVSHNDPDKLSGKFNPTIFDSISVATRIALERNEKRSASNLVKNKKKLIQDKDYQDLIRFRTTNEDRINKRISLALHYLYGETYE